MSAADLHRRAKEVLLDALERDPAERERFVAAACAGDTALEREVWSLLAADTAGAGDDFLERPPLPLGAAATEAPERGRFAPGALVAGRFEIRGSLGAGGMGVVYEAWDRELRQPVALKAIRPEHEGDAARRERFRREMTLARRVTHPNVCRVYDVFHHAAENGEPSTLLAMELLRGQSLAERLAAHGPLSPEDALPLLAQVAAGLDAAHRAGVVHRDFKTSNVMLVPGEGGERAVITDFGVARATGVDEDGATTLTHSGEVVGTPAYMAPEQLLGEPATPASDLYAAGVVAYELLTGRKPFEGSTPFSAAARRLTEDPRPLESILPQVDRRWRRAIGRALERDPADRFRSAGDFVAALAGERVAGPSGARARARRFSLAAGAAALVVLSASVPFAWRALDEGAAADRSSAPTAARRTFAVLDCEGELPNDLAWLATDAAERLSVELEAGGELVPVARERVARGARELGLPTGAALRGAVAKLPRALGADLVVACSLSRVGDLPGDPLRLELGLREATSGGVRARFTELGAAEERDELIGRAADRLRAELDLATPSAEERRAARAKLPESSAAARLYAEGLERLRAFDAAGARERFEEVVAAEGDFALGHLALGEAWEALGFEARARETGRRAYELRAPLARPDQLFVEARFRGWSFEWERAMELYRALFTVFPDRVDVGLRLVSAAVAAGEGDAALATVETLRALPPPRSEDPRIDLAEAEAAWAASDWDRHLRASRAAARRAEELGLRGIAAEASCEVGWGLRYRGELDDAASEGTRCLELWRAAGNPGGEADALNFLATVELDRGDLDGAARRYREAAALERRLGNLNGVAVVSSNLGNALHDAGALDAAAELYAEALDLFEQVGRREGVGMMHNALGNTALGMARLAEAREHYDAALAVGTELGAKRLEALARNNLGNVALAAGELDAAERAFEESLALCRELRHTRLEAYDLYGLGEVAYWRAELDQALSRHREALALREEAGEELAAAESRLALARVALDEGDAAAALDGARRAAEAFHDGGPIASETEALVVQARALLALGRAAEAARTAERAEQVAASGNPVARLVARLALAEAIAAEDRSRAAAFAREVRDQAATLGLLPIELEAGCLVERLDPGSGKSGQRDAGTRASDRGLVRVALRCVPVEIPAPG